MTGEELFQSPPIEGLDQWLFAGRLVERRNGNTFHSPAHSAALVRIAVMLSEWCRKSGLGLRTFGWGCLYRLSRDPDTIVSFDATVLDSVVECESLKGDTHVEGPPLLAIEVVELDEDDELLQQLIDTSLSNGVREVWIIDPFEEIVVKHRCSADPDHLNGDLELDSLHLPGFRCRVAEIFE